ncbi:sugar phosphate isomerase/epimerase family protein [Haliea atlantica]
MPHPPLPLLATCWTIAGNVLPTDVPATSPYSMKRRLHAAAKAGYQGIGLWYEDLMAWEKQTGGFTTLKQELSEQGLDIIELEFLSDWFCEGDARQQSDARRALFLRAAAGLGARHLKVIPPMPGNAFGHAALVDAFGALCEEAARVDLGIAMEMMPMSALPTLEDNLKVVEAVGARNGGLLLDIWHVVRSGIEDFPAMATRSAGSVLAVEVNDAQRAPGADLFQDTLNGRLPCGEGEFHVARFVRALVGAGYQGPIGIEILSDRFRALDPETAARISHDTTATALESGAPTQ